MLTIAPERLLSVTAERFMEHYYRNWITSTSTQPSASSPDSNAQFWHSLSLNVMSDSQSALCDYTNSVGVIATECLTAKHIATDERTIRIDMDFFNEHDLRILQVTNESDYYLNMYYVLFMQSSKSPNMMVPFISSGNSVASSISSTVLIFQSTISEGWTIAVDYRDPIKPPKTGIDLEGFFSGLGIDMDAHITKSFK